MPGPTPLPVRVTNKQRAELRLLREDDDSRLCARAAIILACADGLSNSEVARRENTSPSTVARWRRAFCADGITGLRDAPRSGRPSVAVELSGDEREALLRYQRRLRNAPTHRLTPSPKPSPPRGRGGEFSTDGAVPVQGAKRR